MPALPADILTFWLNAGPEKWFSRKAAFDDAIRLKFEPTHYAAARGEYSAWENTAEGCAALLILLDQFPRNLYRGTAHMFATDPLARRIARKALDREFDKAVDPLLRQFFYLPFAHSEDPADQERAVALYSAAMDPDGLKWAVLHEDIIARFGRFPHRNVALGRVMTPEEQAFLDDGGFAG
ncbi:MAG: DUF924 family protein [Alphaproteobacteria bacterium]